MSIWDLYKRALGMLLVERTKSAWIVLSGIALGIVPIAEQVLLARVVDALTLGQGAFPIIGLWALVGFVGIVAGVIVAVMADRLAHRRRLAALGQAFEHAIILPISYHAEKGSGAVVRTILAGTDALFWNWLSFLREQFVALVGIVVLIPTALYMNAIMAMMLAMLAVVYVLANVLVAQKTSTGQAAVEQYHNNVYGRVGDVLGNVTVVQSYARFIIRSAGHALDHGRAVDRAVSGAHLVGPAHGADAHRRNNCGGRHLCPGRYSGRPRPDHGRRDRRLRRLRRQS